MMIDLASNDLTTDQQCLLVERLGGAAQALRILSGDLAVRLVPASSKVAPTTSLEQIMVVPAGLDFEARVARGAYGWRHDDLIEADFPVTADQLGTRVLKLFHFNRNVSSEDAARLIREAGFEPARIGDILIFGELFPDIQRHCPVVGLGSVAEIDLKRSAPTLWFDGERRTLDLLWLDGDWHRNYRFLGVRPAHGSHS